MARYTSTLNVRLEGEQLEALEWWASVIPEWSLADLVRHFLQVPPPPSKAADPADPYVELLDLRRQVEAEVDHYIEQGLIERQMSSGSTTPGGER